MSRVLRALGAVTSCAALVTATAITMTAGAEAQPNTPPPPLPVYTPTPTTWAPNFNFPHNLRQHRVTEADITSEREMCGWFNAQFDTVMGQINDFNANLAANRDNYAAPGVQAQADAVVANIDQSEEFLDPRARAFTVVQDCNYIADDTSCTSSIPIYEGNDLRRVWQQQSNISTSIKNHNPSGVNNISIGLTNLCANGIKGSGVCVGA